MQYWVNIDKEYLDRLRKHENRIPYSDYGNDRFKPFFSPLFKVGDLYYVTQVSSPKERHKHINEQKDLKKIYDGNILICVINLNYMFPVHKSKIKKVLYKDIEQYRTFNNEKEKSKYIRLLKKELKLINSMDLKQSALELYNLKYKKPDDKISKRCFDYKKLENIAYKLYKQKNNNEKNFFYE